MFYILKKKTFCCFSSNLETAVRLNKTQVLLLLLLVLLSASWMCTFIPSRSRCSLA